MRYSVLSVSLLAGEINALYKVGEIVIKDPSSITDKEVLTMLADENYLKGDISKGSVLTQYGITDCPEFIVMHAETQAVVIELVPHM
jgi:hypothetical protein